MLTIKTCKLPTLRASGWFADCGTCQLLRLLSSEQNEEYPEEFGKDGASTKPTGFF
jgi:hypothetical protein